MTQENSDTNTKELDSIGGSNGDVNASTNGNTVSNGGSFAELFEQEVANDLDRFHVGNTITATVVRMEKDYVTVDMNFKSQGVIPVEEFKDSKGNLLAKLGDEVEVYIVALENEDNQIVVSYEKAYQKKIWEEVEMLFENDGTISGTVMQKVKGGLQVDIGIPAFLPGSQVDIRPHRNLEKFIGETYEFKVLKITKDKGNIVLSRRALLVSERDSMRSETLKVLSEGVVIEGTVKNITDYGAFIDLGGIDGLLHITDICWSRISHPSDKLSVGQSVAVVVLKYEEDKERVSLGMKQLTEDPWITVNEKYPVGMAVKGRVSNIAEYGVFLEFDDGVEGLLNVSDMSWTKQIRNPGKIYSVGEEVEVAVLSLDNEQQRLNVGVKQLGPNPWMSLHERHPVGSLVEGKVCNIMSFGMFISVEDGIDGLVHVSDFSWTKKVAGEEDIQELYKKGDVVKAKVLDIDPDKERLSLGMKQLEEDPWESLSQRYPSGSKITGKITRISEYGVFVEIEANIEGMVHRSELEVQKDADLEKEFEVGNDITVQVLSFDSEKRQIGLSQKALTGDHKVQDSFSDDASVGVKFGDLYGDLTGDK